METHTQDGVILHHVAHESKDSYCDEVQNLDKYDAQDLISHGVFEAWYWYRNGGYEGDGQLVGRTLAGKWLLMNLGHCSCYGPCDDSGQQFDSVEELVGYPYKERLEELREIITAVTERYPVKPKEA